MKIDLTTKIPAINGKSMPLGDLLSSVLGAGTKDKEDHWPCFRLFCKTEDARKENDEIHYSEEDIKIVKGCVENVQIIPFTAVAIEYLLWPEKMADSDKELASKFLASLADDKGNGVLSPETQEEEGVQT